MSDTNTPTTPTGAPNAGAGGDSGQPSQEQPTSPAQPGAQPAAVKPPFAVFETEGQFTERIKRSAKSQMDGIAKDLGFANWGQIESFIATLRQSGQPGQPGAQQPGTTTASAPNSEAAELGRLKMALAVGRDLALPVAIAELLQGSTREEMTAHANTLAALFAGGAGGAAPRAPGIPPAPGAQPANKPTFTRAQIHDAKFVRENAEIVKMAIKEGRIVD